MIKIYSIAEDFVDTRLDRWIKKSICSVPQALIEKNIRKGNIKVNNKKQKSSYKLKKNDQIKIINFNPQTNKNKTFKERYKATNKEISSTNELVIEDNENFIIINKPSGISVQSGTKSRRNIIDILDKSKYFKDSHPYTVHRIDKETTGVLIVAKNRKYAQLFTSLFRIRKIHKSYLGIVIGRLKDKKGILKDELEYFEGKKKISLTATTNYKVLDSNNNYSLLNLAPLTGRKHQIRRQLLMLGHPVLGDSKYRLTYDYKNKKSILMLHAYKISFFLNEKKYEYQANPNATFIKTLKEKYLKNFW